MWITLWITLWITMWITVCPYMHDHARTMRAVCSGKTLAAVAQRTHTERELNIHMQVPWGLMFQTQTLLSGG